MTQIRRTIKNEKDGPQTTGGGNGYQPNLTDRKRPSRRIIPRKKEKIMDRQNHYFVFLAAGLVEILFGTLLFIRARQRALQRNVPFFWTLDTLQALRLSR